MYVRTLTIYLNYDPKFRSNNFKSVLSTYSFRPIALIKNELLKNSAYTVNFHRPLFRKKIFFYTFCFCP